MGQYTIKDVQNRAELLKEATDNIYRAIHTKTGESPETLDRVPGCIMNIQGAPDKEPLEITPSTTEQQFSSKDSFIYDPITVVAVDSSIDVNITPGNIKKGVTILGVEGTLQEGGVGPSGTFTVPSDMSFGYSNFTEIPSYLDFRNMVNMYYTFANCSNLTTIPLIVIPNVTSLDHTFSGCTNLTTIPQLVTTNVQDMKGLFQNCSSLTEIPLLDTSNVQNMYRLFEGCGSLTNIPQLVTTNVQNMGRMFSGCSSLTEIPLLDTSNVNGMSYMFSECYNLTTIPQLVTTNVQDMGRMFSDCSSLTEIPLLDTSNVWDMSNMFYGCKSLANIPQLVTTNVNDMSFTFSGCSSLTEIPLLDTSNVNNMDHMFSDCSSLTTIPQLDMTKVRNLFYTFHNCGSLATVPSLNTSNVEEMNGVFSDCYALTTVEGIDFSGLMGELTHLFGYSTEMPKLTRFIVNGKIDNSISDEYSIKALTAIDYDSVKSILTAAANTTYDYVKTLAFNRTMTDQNGELAALVASCAGKGWTITGLTLN